MLLRPWLVTFAAGRPKGQRASVRFPRIACCLVLALLLMSAVVPAQISVVTWHYDNARSGANTSETFLTPVNVGSTRTFGRLYSRPVDGEIVGQPLYLPNVSIPGKGIHNVVYVATNHDTVYAFDGDNATGTNATPLWITSILTYSGQGATSVPINIALGGKITGFTEHGIISTPVIDPATNIMYLVADTYENQNVVHRLHALDATTGLEVLGGPTTITASYTLNGIVSSFNPVHQMNRPGLLLANGHVYVGFGSPGLNVPGEQGWLMSYNATTLQQEGAFDVEPGGHFAAIWQHGAGLAGDGAGNIYAETGDGKYVPGTNFSESVLKFTQNGTSLPLTDYFTPYNYQFLTQTDTDMSDGILVLPDQSGPNPHELIATDKGATIYVLNRDNMGQLCTTCTMGDTQIVQEFALPGLETGSPVYWNGLVYFTPANSHVQEYTLNNGLLSFVTQQSAHMTGGGHAIITSNGNASGILWTNNLGALWALDAVSLQTLWNTGMAANHRDLPPGLAHFPMFMVANGRLYVPTVTTLEVYGLLPTIDVNTGAGQTGVVASTLPVPLQVQIVDRYTSSPIPGVTVTFSDSGKGGSFSNPTSATDSNGTVSTMYTLPTKTGSYTVTASSNGYQPASMSETSVAGPPAGFVYGGGAGQTGAILTMLPKPLAEFVKDQYGNGVAGVVVSFSDGGVGGNFSTNPVTTTATGLASTSYTTSSRSGTVKISVSANGLTTKVLTETVTPGPASAIAVFSGNNQTGHVSTMLAAPLVSQVTDQYGNPVPGVTVTYSDAGAGGSFSLDPVTTDAKGKASVQYTTPATTGTVTIQATATGVATPATFTENVN